MAKDVCDVLDQPNVFMVCSRLDADKKGITTNDTLGGNQELLIISESGLYSLVLTSRKPQAKAFKKWLTSEVTPLILKTGSYSLTLPIDTASQHPELCLLVLLVDSKKPPVREVLYFRLSMWDISLPPLLPVVSIP